MRTIFYSNDINEIQTKLDNSTYNQIQGITVEIIDSLQCLTKQMSEPLNHVSVIIAWIHKKNELENLFDLLPLIKTARVILVLPDRKQQTILIGIKLNPSFISYQDNNFEDIITVLKKIQTVKRTI
jgi:hypothetical protein